MLLVREVAQQPDDLRPLLFELLAVDGEIVGLQIEAGRIDRGVPCVEGLAPVGRERVDVGR